MYVLNSFNGSESEIFSDYRAARDAFFKAAKEMVARAHDVARDEINIYKYRYHGEYIHELVFQVSYMRGIQDPFYYHEEVRLNSAKFHGELH